MTCEPADRQGCGGRGRGRRGEAAAQPFLSLWVHGSAQRPGSAAPGGHRCRPAQRPLPWRSPEGGRGAPRLGAQVPPRSPPALRSSPAGGALSLQSHPSLRWRWVSKSCAENPEVGGKKGKLATVRGPGSGGWGGVRGELNIGALFPFPGRDMINRFLLI